jgi:hypothetical protein
LKENPMPRKKSAKKKTTKRKASAGWRPGGPGPPPQFSDAGTPITINVPASLRAFAEKRARAEGKSRSRVVVEYMLVGASAAGYKKPARAS